MKVLIIHFGHREKAKTNNSNINHCHPLIAHERNLSNKHFPLFPIFSFHLLKYKKNVLLHIVLLHMEKLLTQYIIISALASQGWHPFMLTFISLSFLQYKLERKFIQLWHNYFFCGTFPTNFPWANPKSELKQFVLGTGVCMFNDLKQMQI